MLRRLFFVLFVLLTSALAPAAEKPNIILVMADDQGWGDMAYYGHPFVKTPNFDAMAEVSLRFDRFYAAAPVCSPTRASVLTGRHPNRVNVLDHGRSMRPQETTIAEALQSAGYVTGHFGKWHVGSCQPTSPVNPTHSGFDTWLSAPNYFDLNPYMSRNGIAEQLQGESSMIVVDETIQFIKKHAGKKPIFAIAWFASPHWPFKTLERDKHLYAGRKMQGYYQEITAMDRAFGKLRAELRNLKIHENTILWYCSDNGGLNEQTSGGRGKKRAIYEGGLRVPGLLEWPARLPKPAVTNVPCVTSDIYPTLIEITGAKVENQYPLDGVSLVPLLEGRMTKRPKPIGFWLHPAPGRSTYSDRMMKALLEAQKAGKKFDPKGRLDLDAGSIKKQYPEDRFPGHAAWLDFPWKLHRIDAKGKMRFELYNLKADPDESKNVLEDEPDRHKAMAGELEAWQRSVIRSLNGKDYPAKKK